MIEIKLLYINYHKTTTTITMIISLIHLETPIIAKWFFWINLLEGLLYNMVFITWFGTEYFKMFTRRGLFLYF